MRVITLNSEELNRHAAMLQDKCIDFQPDMVVGIANGGVRLANLLYSGIPHASIDCHRPSTQRKQGKAARWILRHLPYWVLDQLRICEARLLSRKSQQPAQVRITPAHAEAIAQARRILLVDDAVDSGRTLQACLRQLAAIAPNANIKSAAITTTTSRPAAKPDIFIYDNFTLIRFPWSIDAKK